MVHERFSDEDIHKLRREIESTLAEDRDVLKAWRAVAVSEATGCISTHQDDRWRRSRGPLDNLTTATREARAQYKTTT